MPCTARELEALRDCVVTPKGPVELVSTVPPEVLHRLAMDDGLRNFRPPARQHEALCAIAAMPEGKVSAALMGSVIVGYATFHRPDRYSRWVKHPLMLELGGIEISPSWRKFGLASRLLKVAFADPILENYIVYTTEYCWHWDLKGSGLDVWQYQRMLTKLFGAVGLVQRATDDPDILEHPANVFMVRVGRNVPREQVEAFEGLLFENKDQIQFYRERMLF